MNQDIFKDGPGSLPSGGPYDNFAPGSFFKNQIRGVSSEWLPSPGEQEFRDLMLTLDDPEDRQKAEAAEKERRWMDFHIHRAIPRALSEGWEHLRHDYTDVEIRVYTTNYKRRRFWGIKPAGIGMFDFWEQVDPDVERYDDNVAITWANPLVPPPITEYNKDISTIWAGQGRNPDSPPPEIFTAEAFPPTKATKSRRRQKTTKSSPKTKKKITQKSLLDNKDTGSSMLQDQLSEVETASANAGPSRENPAVIPSKVQQPSAPQDEGRASSKRKRDHPASEVDSALVDHTLPPPKRPRNRTAKPNDQLTTPSDTQQALAPQIEAPAPSKRKRDHPATKPCPALEDPHFKRPRGRPAKPKPAATSADASLPKRPRGRPPGTGKSNAVKGDARVTKPTQRASAPSKHKMRTRGKGAADSLQLPY